MRCEWTGIVAKHCVVNAIFTLGDFMHQMWTRQDMGAINSQRYETSEEQRHIEEIPLASTGLSLVSFRILKS